MITTWRSVFVPGRAACGSGTPVNHPMRSTTKCAVVRPATRGLGGHRRGSPVGERLPGVVGVDRRHRAERLARGGPTSRARRYRPP
jgi:hypothetical protein